MTCPFQLTTASPASRSAGYRWLFILLTLSAGLLPIDAGAVRLSHRIQGGYYLIQVMPESSYPVDCQISWQVRMSDFTRQGQAYLTDVSGTMWSEAMGPMTQDVQTIGYSARCQISAKETERRAIEAERERALQQQQAELLRRRRQAELERQQAEQRRNQAAAEAAARQKNNAAETAARMRAEQAQEAAQQRQQIQQQQLEERRAAIQREQAQRRAQEEAALVREQQRQQQLASRREAMSAAAHMAKDSLDQQTIVKDQELSSIAQGANGRAAEIRQESAAAAHTNQPTQQDMRDYLLQGLQKP